MSYHAFQESVARVLRRWLGGGPEIPEKQGLPSGQGAARLPNYFADAACAAGGNYAWLRAATT
jgi:hypothetical protein